MARGGCRPRYDTMLTHVAELLEDAVGWLTMRGLLYRMRADDVRSDLDELARDIESHDGQNRGRNRRYR